ncbi:MAG: histone deacetylase [Planctomycetota bacterium]
MYYSDGVDLPLPDKHPFPRSKYRLLRERVERLARRLPILLAPGPDATREELLRVHTEAYVDAVFEGQLTEQQQRAIGFPWSEGFVQRSLRSTGSTLAAARWACDAASESNWAAHLAGGTHHAFADHGQGFCVFNDVAVAIRALQAAGVARRVLVLDCDVHQGNGTAKLFAGDDSVFTFSIHGRKNFPLKKEAGDLDIPLEDQTGDEEYLRLLTPGLERAWSAGPYDAVFYVAGADPFVDDRYGRMALSREGLRKRDRAVLAGCKRSGLPTVTVMGGGYARDVEAVADIYAATIEEAASLAAQ